MVSWDAVLVSRADEGIRLREVDGKDSKMHFWEMS